jgi:hypothetical protein
MRSPHAVRLALPLLLALPGLANAERLAEAAVEAEDRASITSCLRESGDAPRACIGTVAVVCSTRQGAGDRAETQITCSRREAAVWRERLDMAATVFAGQLEAGLRSRFTAVQRTWESYYAQKCAFLGEVQAPARAAAMQAACELREVAVRAIEVERLARVSRDGAAAPRPPQIER